MTFGITLSLTCCCHSTHHVINSSLNKTTKLKRGLSRAAPACTEYTDIKPYHFHPVSFTSASFQLILR